MTSSRSHRRIARLGDCGVDRVGDASRGYCV